MAESQLECMEDGRIGESIPESRPEFYYSEPYRVALEELLRDGDGAFKTRLKNDQVKDFLSARELKVIQSTVEKYSDGASAKAPWQQQDSESLRSTYWPDMSDTEVPQLDIGWPSTGFFRGVTRVTVHTHPPKDNGPHIKEVVRKMIQDAHKVIAIVMDLLTDLQIIQDLLDVASKRDVAVYVILDDKGVPHFLDMCNRLEVGPRHLQNVRTRSLRGVGIDLSFGRIPGSLGNKYMIVDGDKVMFGSYSFSWSSSRMDRNIITIMTGQTVDFFDRDFRELYAMSREINLFKEFSISKSNRPPSSRVTLATRPSMPATSRFQVSLGDKGTLNIPAHKYHNPKYLLAFGNLPEDVSSPQDLINKMEESRKKFAAEVNPIEEEHEMVEPLNPPSSRTGGKANSFTCIPSKKKKFPSLTKSKKKGAGNTEGGDGDPGRSVTTPLNKPTSTIEDMTSSPEEPTAEMPKNKKKKKGKHKSSQSEDHGSESRKDRKKKCVIS